MWRERQQGRRNGGKAQLESASAATFITSALSRTAISVRGALVLRETGDSWGDLVGVRGSVQEDHSADVLASPNCLQGEAPGPVPSHEAFRGAVGVMKAERAGRQLLAAAIARRAACLH